VFSIGNEKNFENRLKKWLEKNGIYPLGTPKQDMIVSPIGYYEKRWGGGIYTKKGLPDLHIVVNGINIDAELKAPKGTPSDLQRHNVVQINQSGSIAMILYPDGFESFKKIMEGVMSCKFHIQELKHLKDVHSDTKCDILTEYEP
jgi:hypothetical protein